MASQLTISIDNADLTQLRQSGQQIVLLWQVTGNAYAVIWAAFEPLSQNQVVWNTPYSLYAAEGSLEPGLRLNPRAYLPATSSQRYAFTAFGAFEPNGPGPGPGGNQYEVLNQQEPGSPATTFGLMLTVNGQPGLLSAQAIPTEAQGTLLAPSNLTLLTAADLQPGTVVELGQYQGSTFPAPANTTLNLKYQNGQFVLV